MLNSSKRFVKYLDNYDKIHQKNYHTLLYHIRNEYSSYFDEQTHNNNDDLYILK